MKYLLLFIVSTLNAQIFQSFVQRVTETPIQHRQQVIERYLQNKTTPIIEKDSLLNFVYYGAAESVFVNGNLQHWNEPAKLEQITCGENSLFYKTFTVPPDARLDYKLIINGVDSLDPRNPRTTPSGFGPHSEVRMPKFVSSQYLIEKGNVPSGTLTTHDIYENIPPPLRQYLTFRRTVIIYTPAGYDTLSELSSVYIHDGFEAINFALVPTIIDNLIAEKRIPPIIAVFIPPSQRHNEYIGAQLGKFVNFLSNDLVSFIDARFKTAQSPLNRAMMGISNGGHISLYTVLKRPDVFHAAGGQSSTITPMLSELTKQQYFKNNISSTMKLYLDCGRYDIKQNNPGWGMYDFLEMNRTYSNLLSSLRIPHYYKEHNDGHEWANWRERMPEIFTYFFGVRQ